MQKLLDHAQVFLFTFDPNTLKVKPIKHNKKLQDLLYYHENLSLYFKDIAQFSEERQYSDIVEFCFTDFEKIFYISCCFVKPSKLFFFKKPYLSIMVTDITHQVAVHRNLYSDYQKQLRINKSKMAFMSRMSHEFRTPLNAVIGFSDAIQHKIYGDISKPYLEYVNNIHLAGSHLLDIVNDILDISYNEHNEGTIQLKPTEFSPVKAIENIQKFTHSLLARQKIVVNLIHNMSDGFTIINDANVFKRIFINIIGNASKYCPPFTHLDINLNYCDETGNLDIYVRDYGKGFPISVIENFGTPFNVGNDFHADNKHSIGLGLCIIKSSIEAMNGVVRIKNHPLGGAVIVMTIPADISQIETPELKLSGS